MQPLQPDTTFHIFNHANGFENIFLHQANYYYFLEKYQLYISPIAETYAYCLMPNHFHLIVRIRKREVIAELILRRDGLIENTFSKVPNFGKGILNDAVIPDIKSVSDDRIEKYLSKQFSNLFSCYTQSFNKVYNRRGSLFIKNFKRQAITNKAYFLNAVVYVHRNPIHHGFCTDYAEWPYSSFTDAVNPKGGFIESKKLLQLFDNELNYNQLHAVAAIGFDQNFTSDMSDIC